MIAGRHSPLCWIWLCLWTIFAARAADARVGEALFEGPVRHVLLELEPGQAAILRGARYMGAQTQEATGTVRVGNETFTGVRMHLKGSGSFRQFQYRPSLTLHFPSDHPLDGLTKLHLNNSVHDPSRLCEVLGSELHRQAGDPTPRATPVQVTLNGRYLGVYVLKEGFDKKFLKREFGDGSGTLYGPAWGQDIDQPLEPDLGGTPLRPGELDPLQNLFRTTQLPVATRLPALEKILDVDRFVTGVALQLMTEDWDGYAMHHNNYRLYYRRQPDRFVFLPHGMDMLFGAPRNPVFWPEITGLAARSLFEIDGQRERVRRRVTELNATVFAATNVLRIFERGATRLEAALATQTERERAYHHRQLELLRGRIQERLDQLAGKPQLPVVLAPGEAHQPKFWYPLAEVFETDTDEVAGADGRMRLHLAAHQRSTAASWRARVLLPPGTYRFEGRVELEGVTLNPMARDPGVGLRVVPARRGEGLSGTHAETPLSHTFRLRRPTEVVLVAEFSGHAGRVDFLRDSLRVVRVGAPGE